MTLTDKPAPMRGARRTAAVACCVVAFATCTSALTLRMDVSTTSRASERPVPKTIFLSAEIMTGLKISGANPTYPKEARAKRIQGTVELQAIIGKDGGIRDLQVLNSPNKVLSDSSLTTVRTWRYHPYLINGEPVEVKTTIKVIYKLGR